MIDLPEDPGVVAFDTETSGLHPDDGARVSVVSLAWEGGALALPFGQGPSQQDRQDLGWAEWDRLIEWMSRQDLVAHNAKFDLAMMRAGAKAGYPGIDLVDRIVWDTQIVSPLIWPHESSALKETASRLWGIEQADEQEVVKQALKSNPVGQRKRYDLLAWDVIGPYAVKDAELTLRLYRQQVTEIGLRDDLVDLVAMEIELMRTLTKMEQRGVGFDVAGCAGQSLKLRAELERIDSELPYKPTPAGAAKYLFADLALKPVKTTPTGRPSLDAESLAKMAKTQPAAAVWANRQLMAKAISNFFGAWPDLTGDDGRLRAVFNQTRVISGRLSVSRVQLQAIPHDYRFESLGVESIRSFFTPAPGKSLWEVDLSQAEVRVATCIAQEQAMADALAAGQDAHDATTRLVFGIEKDHPDWDKMRSIGKRLTFAMLYGAGERTVHDQIGAEVATLLQVREWVGDYRSAFPEFVSSARLAERVVQRRGYLILVNGRRRYYGKGEKTHSAFNQVIQGGVAEMMKKVMIEVERELPGVLLLQIHDSLVLEVDHEGQVHRVQDIMVRVFDDAFKMDDGTSLGFRADAKRWS